MVEDSVRLGDTLLMRNACSCGCSLAEVKTINRIGRPVSVDYLCGHRHTSFGSAEAYRTYTIHRKLDRVR